MRYGRPNQKYIYSENYNKQRRQFKSKFFSPQKCSERLIVTTTDNTKWQDPSAYNGGLVV